MFVRARPGRPGRVGLAPSGGGSLMLTREPMTTPAPDTRPSPQDYIDAGFRVLRCHPEDKRPLVGGFGKDAPDFTCEAKDFRFGERIALLLGHCPFIWDDSQGESHLICLDLDHGLTVEEIETHTGPLPDTLTSKGGAHLYYRVEPSEARDQLRQWTNVLKTDDPKAGALDLKWHGGYAIEPGNVPGGWDDGGFDPNRIAVLPDAAVQAFVKLKSKPESAPRTTEFEVDPSAYYQADAVNALALIWPEAGNHFDCALALGGVLATSRLIRDEALDFAVQVFGEVGCDRLRQVEVSFQNVRSNAGVEVKGWPTLKALLKSGTPEYDAAFKTFVAGIPGLDTAPKPSADAVAVGAFAEKIMSDPAYCAPVVQIVPRPADAGDWDLEVEGSDAVTIAEDVMRRKLPGSVFCDGALWACEGVVWKTVDESLVSCWTQSYSGAVCGHTAKGDTKHLQVSAMFVKGVYALICDRLKKLDFFNACTPRVVFQNGILDIASGEFRDAVPNDRVRHHLPFDYSPTQLTDNPPVNWINFVVGQWEEDADSIELLHQILGYLLSGRMDHEKMFVMLGPARSGKGTIIKLLQAIMGEAVGTFKISQLDQTFGMSSMMGKSVLVDPDVRKSKSAFRDSGAIAERLLSLTSGDMQAVRVMRQNPIDVVLPGRVLVATNPPFELADEGGALATRIVVLSFNKGHVGSEDRGLLARLKTEIPGIVAMALEGLASLTAKGDFNNPLSSIGVKEDIRLAQNPLLEWFDDCCEAGDGEISADELHQKVAVWWANQGYTNSITKRRLSNFLVSQGIRSERVRIDGRQMRVYKGVRLLGDHR